VMHYIAKHGIETTCHPSAVCKVGGSRPCRLEIFETNCMDN